MRTSPFWRVLKNRHFVRLWANQIVSQMSAYLLNFVLLVRIYEETGSTTALSIFMVFYMAPSIILGLVSGAFIDYWNKKQVLIWTNLLQAIVVLLYLGVDSQIWVYYPIVFLYSLCDEFFGPAQLASLPALVKKERLPAANSFLLLTNQLALLVGSILGSFMLKFFSPDAPFILVFGLLLLMVKIVSRLPAEKLKGIKQRGTTLEQKLQGLIADVADGYRLIASRPRVLYPFGFYILAQVMVAVNIVLFPPLAEGVFGIKASDSGWAMMFPAGLGAVLGSWYVSAKLKDWGRKKLISVGWLITGFSYLTLAIGAPLLAQPLYLTTAMMFSLGIGIIVVITTSQLMVQENTPASTRGRVFGTLSALMIIASYLPLFFIAAITDWLGILPTILAMGGALLAIGLVSLKIDRRYVLSNGHRT